MAIANADGSNEHIRSIDMFCGICKSGNVCGIPPNALPIVDTESNLKIDCAMIPHNNATTGAGMDRKMVYLLNNKISKLTTARMVVG